MKSKKPLLIGIGVVVVVVLIIVFGVVQSQKAEPTLANFAGVNTYTGGQFLDVPASVWYADNVATAYRLGLMKGSSATIFNAQGNITVGETIALACRIYSIYNDDGEEFTATDPWYEAYVTYALDNCIITYDYDDYDAKATRAEFAVIMAGALPGEALNKINKITDGAIPDIAYGATYESAVYKLYRAGILTGNDEIGTFAPWSNISRGEVATIATRMADQNLRKNFSLSLYAQCSPALYHIDIYDDNDQYVTGNDVVFINDQGDAIMAYHAIKNAASATVSFEGSDETYKVESILGYNTAANIAIIHVDGEGFKSLKIGNTDNVTKNQKVYLLSSWANRNWKNTLKKALITDDEVICYNIPLIKINILHHSVRDSGGVVLNESGEAIGVITMYADSDECLLATPLGDYKSYYLQQPIKLN